MKAWKCTAPRGAYPLLLFLNLQLLRGQWVFEANGHTAAEAREFYDQGALDDVAAWMAAEIVRRRYKNFDEVRGFIRARALDDVPDAMLREALDD